MPDPPASELGRGAPACVNTGLGGAPGPRNRPQTPCPHLSRVPQAARQLVGEGAQGLGEVGVPQGAPACGQASQPADAPFSHVMTGIPGDSVSSASLWPVGLPHLPAGPSLLGFLPVLQPLLLAQGQKVHGSGSSTLRGSDQVVEGGGGQGMGFGVTGSKDTAPCSTREGAREETARETGRHEARGGGLGCGLRV